MTVLVFTSVLVTPVVGAGQAPTANESTDIGETNTQQSVETSTVSDSATPQTSGDTLEEDRDLSDDYPPINRGLANLQFSSVGGGDAVSVQTIPTSEAPTLTEVNFGVQGTPASPIPFTQPVLAEIEVTESSTGDVEYSEAIALELKPSLQDSRDYQATGRATFTVDQDSTSTYDVSIETRGTSSDSSPTESTTQSLSISGESQGTTASGSIEEINGFRTLPSQEFVDSYRVSGDDEDANYGEEVSLPQSEQFDDMYGFVSGFENMTSNNSSAAVFQSEDGQMNITTRAGFIEDGNTQTLLLRYRAGASDDVSLNVIDGNGRAVDSGTEYNLGDLSSAQCIEGNVSNLCAIELSEDETNYINQRGEMFLSYESPNNTQVQVFCQEVVTNSLNQNDTACGLSEDGTTQAPTTADGIISNFGLLDGDGDIDITSDQDNIDPVSASEGLGIEVTNTGSESLPSDTPVILNSSLNNSSLSSESDSTTAFNSTPDRETVTLGVTQNYPTQAVELEFDGDVDQGYVGVLIQTTDGEKYVQLSNFSGTQTVDLSGIAGTTDSVTVTMNAVYNDSIASEDRPEITEVRMNATDIQGGEVASTTLGGMSGGSGSLAPGSSRTHEFGTDVETQLANNLQVTYTTNFLEDQDQIELSVNDDLLVADAGGPYQESIEDTGGSLTTETREGDEITRELSTKPYSELGFGWEQGPAVGSAGGTETWTTEHENIPEVNLTGQSAIDYYVENGYITFPEKRLPGDANDWSVADIRYEEYRSDEELTALESEISDIEGHSRSDMNWQQSNVAGETTTNWKQVQATRVLNNQNDLVWNVDEDQFMYNPPQPTVDQPLITARIIEQAEDPTNVSDFPRCEDVSGEETCWELTDESIRVEQELDGFNTDTSGGQEPYICQNVYGYYDPGPEWSLEYTDFSGFGGIGGSTEPISERCSAPSVDSQYQYAWYQQDVESQREVNEWTLQTKVNAVNLDVPEEETYYEWTRPRYDTEIVWERSSQGSTTYEWTGSEVQVQQVVDSPGQVNVDGSASRDQSQISIEEFEWRVKEYENASDDIYDPVINSSDYPYSGQSPQIDLLASGEFTLELTVRNGEITDTDTTTIDVSKVCTGSDCGQTQSLDLSATDHSELVSYTADEIDIEYAVQGSYTKDEELQIVAVPGASTVSVSQDESCPSGYDRVSYSSVSSPVAFEDQVEDPSTTEVCQSTSDSTGDATPDKFIHPEYLDRSSVEFVSANPSAEQEVWTGTGIPRNGLNGLAEVNPRENDAIVPTADHRTTLELRSTQNPDNVYDTATVSSVICESENREVENTDDLIAPECGDLDEDLDGSSGIDDECPNTPVYTEKPCEEEPPKNTGSVQAVRFGRGDDPANFTDGLDGDAYYEDWNIQSQTPNAVQESAPQETNPNISDTAYDSRNIELGYSGREIANDTLAWWSFDDTAPDLTWDNSTKFNVIDNVTRTQDGSSVPPYGAKGYYDDDQQYDYISGGTSNQSIGTSVAKAEYTLIHSGSGDTLRTITGPTDSNFSQSNVTYEEDSRTITVRYRTSDGADEFIIGSQEKIVLEGDNHYDPNQPVEDQFEVEYEEIQNDIKMQEGIEGPTGHALRSGERHWIELAHNRSPTTEQLSVDLEEQLKVGTNLSGTGDGVTLSMFHQYENPANGNGVEQAIIQKDRNGEPFVVATTEQEAMPEVISPNNLEWVENPNPDADWSYSTSPTLVYNFDDTDGEYRGLTTIAVDIPSSERGVSGRSDYEVISYTPHEQARPITGFSTQDFQGSYAGLGSLKVVPAGWIEDYNNGGANQVFIEGDKPKNFARQSYLGGIDGRIPNGEPNGLDHINVDPSSSVYSDEASDGDAFDPRLHRTHAISAEDSNIPILVFDSARGIERIQTMNAQSDWMHIVKQIDPQSGSAEVYINPATNLNNLSPDARIPYGPTRGISNPSLSIHGAHEPKAFLQPINNQQQFRTGTTGKIGDIRLYQGIENDFAEVVEKTALTEAEFTTEQNNLEIDSATQDEIDNGSLTNEEVYFTKENVGMYADINWGDQEFSQNPAKVTVEAVPVTKDGVEKPDSTFEVTYIYEDSVSSVSATETRTQNIAYKGGNSVTTSVDNNLAEDELYQGFKINVTLDTFKETEAINPVGVNYIEMRNYNEDSPGSKTVGINEDQSLIQSGSDNSSTGDVVNVKGSDPTDPDNTGGIMQMKGVITESFASNETVPVKFVVKETGTTLAEGQISVQDTSTITFSRTHQELAQEEGIPTDTDYDVTFVIIGEGQPWDKKEVNIGTFNLGEYVDPTS